MRYFVALLALVAFSAHAQTGTATLTCVAPTKNTDGTSISGPISYTFLHGTSSTSFPDSSPAQSTCGYTWTGLSPGAHFFVARATVNGVVSGNSNVASVTIAPPTPNAPTGLVVTVTVAVTVGP